MIRQILFPILSFAIFASGCVAVDSKSPYTETSAICDNASLDSYLVSIRDQSRRVRGALAVGTPKGGGAIGVGKTQYDVERQYELRDKLNYFDAEVDAQYQNVTASCKAFTRCMEKNGYNEGSCQQTMRRWDDSEREFRDLSVKLREIEADVTKFALKTQRHKKCRGKKCHPDPCGYDGCRPDHPPRDRGCCDTINGIFTDCCDGRR